ncbi:MAG: cytochrome C oxidase subunit IV family protein [Chloroherpetonaceae bacterium]|nr:cytochrome C oxidase subunit IV family protein [Chloroherpetonaceae bacterium]
MQHSSQSHSLRNTNTHHPHILPLKLYLMVGGALLFLTVITVWVAQFDFGALNLIVAMTVATIKAGLVAAFFMHLYYDNKFYTAILLIGLVALAVFIAFTMIDGKSRTGIYENEMQEIRKKSKMYDAKPNSTPAPKTEGK